MSRRESQKEEDTDTGGSLRSPDSWAKFCRASGCGRSKRTFKSEIWGSENRRNVPYFREEAREEELSKFPRISLVQKSKLSQQSFPRHESSR